jgi:hypothetical protein
MGREGDDYRKKPRFPLLNRPFRDAKAGASATFDTPPIEFSILDFRFAIASRGSSPLPVRWPAI